MRGYAKNPHYVCRHSNPDLLTGFYEFAVAINVCGVRSGRIALENGHDVNVSKVEQASVAIDRRIHVSSSDIPELVSDRCLVLNGGGFIGLEPRNPANRYEEVKTKLEKSGNIFTVIPWGAKMAHGMLK